MQGRREGAAVRASDQAGRAGDPAGRGGSASPEESRAQAGFVFLALCMTVTVPPGPSSPDLALSFSCLSCKPLAALTPPYPRAFLAFIRPGPALIRPGPPWPALIRVPLARVGDVGALEQHLEPQLHVLGPAQAQVADVHLRPEHDRDTRTPVECRTALNPTPETVKRTPWR